VHEQFHPPGEGFHQLFGGGAGEADHVDDNVWVKVGDPACEIACSVL
jgi:hypothetical protein